ncbi:MAG TPA: sigma-70 family RNA polymerase sigma factor [Tepidisphaeraceae bacterium]|jgi:RNA polymerase sigma factor (sigma-70 family)|nr:sigma-70 family RNA polymerase sigma factor [Tepidisphaeraceae bacterium]
MAKFRLDMIAELARQMGFTPHETRSAQLTSAETLLHELDTAKAYPYDFVLFRITGYHPKSVPADLLTGMALQHDLGLLIETVSNTLDVHTAEIAEPVLSIEDVTERFNVTSKTIQRWRRKGLPARRFLFPDGKRRVGFLLSSVERFVRAHTDQVAEAANFTHVDEAEREQILRRARRLATQCGCCQHEISRRIGRRLRRSPLTILHTIRKHDAENPGEAIFPLAAEPITESQRVQISRWNRRGVALPRIARKLCRPSTAIYRILIEERVARLNKKKIKFVDDAMYHQADAEQAIEEIIAQEMIGAGGSTEEQRVPRDLPPYLQELYRTPLLSPSRERGLFLKFNYRKYQFVAARREIEQQTVRARDLNHLEMLLKRVTETKNEIVRANLRLVVSIARKHLRPGLSLMELISDGNLSLMRAVDSFDTHKGNRFSTYATYALMTGFARSVPTMLAEVGRVTAAPAGVGRLAELADPKPQGRTEEFVAREEVATLVSKLSDRERTILLAHYGIGAAGQEGETYGELARKLKISSHRIRQIEQQAIAKLRATALS